MCCFSVIAATDLGQKSDVLKNAPITLGQSSVSIHANTLNGNLFVKDHTFAYEDRGMHFDIGMVYNSQAEQPWRINLGKKILDVQNFNKQGSKLQLEEEDGHKTTFEFDSKKSCYIECGPVDGARTLTQEGDSWVCWNPTNGQREFYDKSMRLQMVVLPSGAFVKYQYDDQGRFVAFETTSTQGKEKNSVQRVEVEYTGNEIQLSHVKNGKRTGWASYTLDNQNRLIKSRIPVADNITYDTEYDYSKNGLLSSIKQSDTTRVRFEFGADAKLAVITDGEGRKHGFSYNQQTCQLVDPLGNAVKYSRDQNGNLNSCTDGVHDQVYSYDNNRRLETVTYKDRTTDRYEYDQLGLCKKVTDRNGDVTLFNYNQETGVLISSTKVCREENKKSATSFYVFNEKRQLCFEINPVGCVTEYGYDKLGNRSSKRIYKDTEYDVSRLTIESAIRMTDMQTWLSKADKSKASLTEWRHNDVGQIIHEVSYANLDKSGQGIIDHYASSLDFEWNDHGECIKKTRKLDEKNSSVESVQYDGLGRIKEECDVIGRIKRHSYRGASHMIVSLATGLDEIIKVDRSGKVVESLEVANGKVRDTVNVFDQAGRCCIVRQFDGSSIYHVYDQFNRKKFSIDAAKKVTAFKYDENNNLAEIIKYANAIESVNESLLLLGNLEPKPIGKSSVEKRQYDAESRLRFTIDAENYVTELRYDSLGNLSDKILYADKYAGTVPPKTNEKDRHCRYFYHNDGSKQAEQLASGHVIVYKRNKKGELVEEVRFSMPQDKLNEFDINQIKQSTLDEKDSYKRDARGQCIEHCDAEQYITTNEYDAAGRVKSKRRGNHEEKFAYDALDRVTYESDTTGLEVAREFHANDQLKFEEKRDRTGKSESRQLLQKFDEFGQTTKVITDKKTISKMSGDEFPPNAIAGKKFTRLMRRIMNIQLATDKPEGLWARLHSTIAVHHKEVGLNVATTIMDEISRQKQLLSVKAEKTEDVKELIAFARVYCAVLRKAILQDSWRTYFSVNIYLEHAEGSVLPRPHILPDCLSKSLAILKDIATIQNTDDLVELQSIKKKLVEMHTAFDDAYKNKGYWRHDKTHDFYDKIRKTLSPLDVLAEDAKKKNQPASDERIDEQRFYSKEGLCVATCNAMGHYTYYYYDELRRPIIEIDPRGAITEKKYDSYTDAVKELRRYKNRVSPLLIPGLVGGKLSDEIRDVIATLRSDEDEVSVDKRDRRGLVVEKWVSGEISEGLKYNAFSELEERSVAINAKENRSVTDKFEHDKKGRVTKIIHDALGQAVEEKFKHNDEQGETIHTDGEGNEVKTYYDRLHRLVKRIDALGNEATTEWDELSRIKKEMNELKQTTHYLWSQDGRTVNKATTAGFTSIEKDIFGQILEILQSTGGEPIKVKKKYNDRGQVQAVDTGNGETIFEYDSNGQVEFTITPAGIQTHYIRNVAGQVEEQIEDVKGLQRHTRYKRDSQGRIEEMCNPEGVWTKYKYKHGDEVESIVDPDGLNIVTTKVYDGLHQLTEKTVGDKSGLDQHKQKFINDNLGRCLSEHVDPQGLNIATSNTFDAVGNVKSITDPNGRVTWIYYDALSRERFRLSPDREVCEKQYDALGNCIYERRYNTPFKNVDFAALKTKDMETELTAYTKEQDNIIHYVFDKHNKPRYKVRVLSEADKPSQGLLDEFGYDEAGRETSHVRYAKMIGLDMTKSIKENIDASQNGLRDASMDRVIYRKYDSASQERFVIDQSGRVTEKKYDENGKITSEIQYATAIDLAFFNEHTSLDDVEKLIQRSPDDRATHRVYDNLQRKIYKVSTNGYVKKYEYDGNDKRTSVCSFKDKYPIAKDETYDALVKSLKELKPDSTKDTITHVKYDHAGRVVKTTDAAGCEDNYEADALGCAIKHTDRNGQQWVNEFDRAKRLVKEISPETIITVVKKAEDGKLTHEELKAEVVNKTDFDKSGNKTSLSFADNIAELSHGIEKPRLVKTDHDSQGRVIGTKVPGATIAKDDAIIQKDLETKNVRDYAGRNVIEVAANGGKKFTVYDQIGRKRFTVDAEGYVAEYRYNHAFDEPEMVVHYSNGMDKTLLAAREKPFTVAEMGQFCNTLSSKLDRTMAFTYNQKGQKQTAKKSKAYVVRPSIDEKGERLVLTKEFERLITFDYNAFGELIAERHARMDGKPDSSIQRFYDQNGNEIATVTAQGYITLRTFGMKNVELSSTQYFKPIPADKRGTLAEIVKAIQPDPINDRRIIRKYDRRHLCVETTVADGHPFFNTYRDADRALKTRAENSEVTTQTEYDANGEPVVLTDAYGEKSYLIRNAVGDIVWEIGFPVEVAEGVKQIPVRQFLYNAHRQPVGSVIYAMPGKLEFDHENHIVLNNLVTASEMDQKILTLMCNRGLPLMTQDSEKGTKFTGFNEGRKPVKSTRFVTVPVLDDAGRPQLKLVTREKRWGYNLRDDLIKDHKIDDFDNVETHFEINAFGECTGEGPELGTYYVKHRFDNAGYKWFTNADRGIATISFPDENDAEALFFRSATQDFHKYLEENGYERAKKELADADYEKAFTEFQRWVTYRNQDEQATRQDTPYYRSRPKSEPENYNVTFTVIKNPNAAGYMLRFDCPEEVFLKMVFILRRKGTKKWEEIKVELEKPLTDAHGRQFLGIPLGERSSDAYEFCLDFYHRHANGEVERFPSYRAEGDVMLDTGNYAASTQPIWYMENSTTLVIAGAAAQIFGIELLQDDKPVKRVAGTRLADGRLRIDLAGIPGNEYSFKYVLGTAGLQAGDCRVNLYHPQFVFNNENSISTINGTFPAEIAAQFCSRMMSATKAILPKGIRPRDSYNIDGFELYWGNPIAGALVSIRDGSGQERYVNQFVAKAPWRFGAKEDAKYSISYASLAPNATLPLLVVNAKNPQDAHALIVSGSATISSLQLTEVNNGNLMVINSESLLGLPLNTSFTVATLSSQPCSEVVANLFMGSDNENYFQPEEIAITNFSIETYTAGGYREANPRCVDGFFAYQWDCSLGDQYSLHINHIGVNSDIMNIKQLPRSPRGNRIYYQQFAGKNQHYAPGPVMLSLVKDGDSILFATDAAPHFQPINGGQEMIDDYRKPSMGRYANIRVQHLHNSTYDNLHVLYFKKLPQGTTSVVFEYVYTTSSGKKEWRPAVCHITAKGGLSVLTNNIPAGHYECRILCRNGDNVLRIGDPRATQDKDGYCHMNINITKKEEQFGQVFSNKVRDKKLKVVKPFREMEQDPWGNQRSVTDRKGNKVVSDFNLFNQAVATTTPPVITTAVDSTTEKAPLTSHKQVNKRAHVVAEVDEGGDSRKHLLNQKGQHLCTEDADGVQDSHEYDLLSHCTASRSAAFGIIRSRFERKDRLLIETREYPNQSTEVITYNEDGHEVKIMSRVAIKNNDNDATYIHPDDHNRARITFHPLSRKEGTTTRATTKKDFHSRSGVQTKEVNQEGREQTWSVEGERASEADKYIGNIAKHVDLAGQVIVYTLNFNKQIVKEVGTVDALANQSRGVADNRGSPPLPRNLGYLFDEAGRESDIIDNGAQLTTRKRHNKEDYCKEYYFIGHNGKVYQATNTTYDELHRIHDICDTHLLIEFGYDKKSHRRYAKAIVLGDDREQKELCRESWFDYSPAGRVRFRDCVLEKITPEIGQIKLTAGQGMAVTYQAGRVRQQLSILENGKKRTVTPVYGVGSEVKGIDTVTEGEPKKTEVRQPDSGDRLLTRTVTSDDKTVEEKFTLDIDGSILSQESKIKTKENGETKLTTVVRSIKSKTALELVETVVTTVHEVIKGVRLIVTDEVTTHYTAADTITPGAVQTRRISAVTKGHNPDGNHVEVEKEAAKVKQARIVTRNNANGAVTGIGPDAPTDDGTFPDGYRHFEINSENCYLIKESMQGRNYYFYAQKRPGKTTLMAYFGDIPEEAKKLSRAKLQSEYKPKVLNIDVNHQPFSANFPPTYPGKYTADGVKTYRELAEELNFTGYADAIAWANNADADSIPSAGTEIVIPTMITEVPETAFNGSLPAIEMLLGSMYPALAMPHITIRPPKVDWALLAAEVAVAAAVIYFTAGALSGPVATMLGSQIAGAAVASGVAGMAGNAAAQGVAIAAHQQQGFNVRSMATQGVASAVSGGVLGATSSASSTAATSAANAANASTTASTASTANAAQSVMLSDVAMSIATAEAVTAAQQAVLMAAGLQSKPDWRGFATAAFNGAAGSAVKSGLGDDIIAANTYTGVTVTGDLLIRGEIANGDVLTAIVVGSMVGNYAGQKGMAYMRRQAEQHATPQQKQPEQHATPRQTEPRASASSQTTAAMSVHERQTMAEVGSDIEAERLRVSDPTLDIAGATDKGYYDLQGRLVKLGSGSDQLSEVNPAVRFIRGAVNGVRNIPGALYDVATTPAYMQPYKAVEGLFTTAVMYSAADTGTRAEMLGNIAGNGGGTVLLAGAVGLFASSRFTLFSTAPRASLRMQLGEVGVGAERTVLRAGTEGVELASQKLLQAIQNKGRTVVIAKPGTEEYRYLQFINAEANVGGSDMTHILLKENPSKAAVLEEFLHGTQQRLGIIDRIGTQGAEVHVKDFMIRHQKMLGLSQEDVNILYTLKDRDINLLNQMNNPGRR